MVLPAASLPLPLPPTPPGARLKPPQKRASLLALGASAFIHLVLALLLPSLMTSGPPSAALPRWLTPWSQPVTGERIVVLELRPPPATESARLLDPDPAAAAPELPEPEIGVPPVTPADVPVGALGEAPGPGGAGDVDAQGGAASDGHTAAERLRPRVSDPRLWVPLTSEIAGLSDEQRARLELSLAIAVLADSMATAEETTRRATDWTYTDAVGRRWGFSPGFIHLGELTIPVPFGFSTPANSLAARRAYEDAEIAGQAGRAEARQTLRDRAAEIRRRRDAERARARADTIGRPL